MEYPLFNNCIPIESFSSECFSGHGYHTPPRLSSSDSSMDADMRESIKLKDVQEDEFFPWTGDMSVNLDNERNAYPLNDSNQLCADDHGVASVKHELSKTILRNISENQHKIEDFQKQSKFSKNIQMGKDRAHYDKEEGESYGKLNCNKPLKARKISEGGNKEMDMYLEKPHISIKNQMNCDMVMQESGIPVTLPRKRKLEAAWQNSKARTLATQREMLSNGRIQSGWNVDELEIDLSADLSNGSYSMSEALLSLPVFKQEAPSPTNGPRDPNSPPRGPPPWLSRPPMMMNNGIGMNSGNNNCSSEQHSPTTNQVGNNNSNTNQQQGIPHNGNQQNNHIPTHSTNNVMGNSQNFPVISNVVSYANGLQDSMNIQPNNANQGVIDVPNGLICSPQLDVYGSFPNKPIVDSFSQDNRFQYVLAAATSIATKCNEDTLTYLNQCQSYEIKLKKLGDLSHCRGKILKSVIRICFHERRLQFAEREQMSIWQNERPGERIVEVDVPLSYGIIHVSQPTDHALLNTVEFYWDPVKEVGVYIKVNCISTEFTAKKHGGEKGVPFRIQVETFLPGEGPPGTTRSPAQPVIPDKRLHAAACQIKVFKLKGADRKHKQDREKILRRPPSERDKYQPSYDCTIFTDLPNDAVFSPLPLTSQPYSPENCGGITGPPRPSTSSSTSPPRMDQGIHHIALHTPMEMKFPQRLSRADSHGSSLDCEEENMGRAVLHCTPGSPTEGFEVDALTESSTPVETRAWLSSHRFIGNAQTFGNFSGADLLRLSRDDLIQICGLADGIRLYNALHAERAPARLTLYLKNMGEQQYNAMYLRSCQVSEFRRKIQSFFQDGTMGSFNELTGIFVAGPNAIKIRLTDEVVQNFKNDSMFRLELTEGGVILKPA